MKQGIDSDRLPADAAASICLCFANDVGHSKLDLATLDIAALLTWRTVSPSAMLMVDPRNGARAVIRDTGSAGGRYLLSILAEGDMQPISEGRTDNVPRAQSIAKAALRAYGEKRLRSGSIRM